MALITSGFVCRSGAMPAGPAAPVPHGEATCLFRFPPRVIGLSLHAGAPDGRRLQLFHRVHLDFSPLAGHDGYDQPAGGSFYVSAPAVFDDDD